MTHIIPLLAASLVSSIWQSALLAACVAICMRLLPGVTATARSVIWTGVFFLMTLLPFAPLYSGNSSATAQAPRFHVEPVWAFVLAGVWALLSLLRAARLLHSAFRLYTIATRTTPVVPPGCIADLLSGNSGGNRKTSVLLCASGEVDVPSVAGFFRPRILIPATLLATISPADLHQVVLHELEHLRRRDDWTNLLQKLALVVFPLNPVLLWVERRLCIERELACDDGVLRASTASPKAYATCLANLAEHSLMRRGLSLALGAWRRQSELTRRVHRILLREPRRSMGRAQTLALASLLLSAAVGTAFVAEKAPRLVTFGPSPVPAAAYVASTPSHTMRSFHPTLVNAMMPQSRPASSTFDLRKPAQRPHRRRVAPAQTHRRPTPSSPTVVLIGWQRSDLRPRWTLALPPSYRFASQFTYAAVPTPNGWYFIQL